MSYLKKYVILVYKKNCDITKCINIMTFIKKRTYEQHDNEEGSFYKSSVKPFKGSGYLDNYLEVEICIIGGGLKGV